MARFPDPTRPDPPAVPVPAPKGGKPNPGTARDQRLATNRGKGRGRRGMGRGRRQ